MKKRNIWIYHKPIAHRGLHSGNALIPENSLKAFEAAIDKGYPIELDVHLLKDNEVVVFHDESLERMCGSNEVINNLTSKEIKEYRLLESSEQIPLLKEVFDFVEGRTPILIEIKSSKENKGVLLPLANLIKGYSGYVAIQSFNPFYLRWFAKNAPLVVRGQLSGSFEGEPLGYLIKFLLRNYVFNFMGKPDFIAHEVEDLKENRKVKRLREKNMPVLGWTVREVKTFQEFKPYLDNIIFENFLP
ncbi:MULTISPECIES: glycerophosphodiester phosphodiesterase family protein [Flavobacteriaceae]|uniref:glycerophosphodiester phosphodiesterase family protein n=1 Tax=Flavobacteriaceae TaxID=49546 RepID=UPI002349A3CA|nr:glycerophosphodiester phosphodiesterase family protein [Muricauda sp. SP22]MDC6361648.1 glycerophosphodiester phosphodiesterase family protein [Muricauda sp. SP22]